MKVYEGSFMFIIFVSYGQLTNGQFDESSKFTHNSVKLVSRIIRDILPVCEIAFSWDNPSSKRNHEIAFISRVLGSLDYQESAGLFNFPMEQYTVKPRRFDDIHRVSSEGSCTHVLIFLERWEETYPETLFNLLTPVYTSISRKDEDYYFFVTPQASTLDRLLLSPKFGGKIKFKIGLDHGAFMNSNKIFIKTVDFYYSLAGPKLISFGISSQNIPNDLFQDFTKNYRGYPLRLAIPKAPFRFELEKRADNRYYPKRGTYKPWVDAASEKLNFSYVCFYSSYGGGTGIQFENGSWVGAVADVRDNIADMAFFIAHIYNRHKVVDWSAPLSYEWIVFVIHKPKYYYSPYAIFRPFKASLWSGFLISIVCMTICLKTVAHFLAKQLNSVKIKNKWTLQRSIDYILATFLEQDRAGPATLPYNPIRIMCAGWLLFGLVTSNAYRAKLVSVMAFPAMTFVPRTYEELVDSHYGAGMHVIGKGDAAYTIFQQGKGRVYEGIFARLEISPSPLKCLLKAVHEDFGCLMWEGLNDYLNAKNISRRGGGGSPTQVSITKTSFINDGLIYERRAIIRKHLDNTILAARDTGLTKKWVDIDFDIVRKARFQWERSEEEKSGKSRHSQIEDTGPKALDIDNCVAAVYILFAGLIISVGRFMWELFSGRVSVLKVANEAVENMRWAFNVEH